jgi:hypothetical protein
MKLSLSQSGKKIVLRAFENKVLRRIFGNNRQKITERQEITEHHNLKSCTSSTIVKVMKPKRI